MFNHEKAKELLRSRSIEQKELVEAVGGHKTTVSRIMNGDLQPSLKMAERIADYLGVKVDDLITKETA